MATRISVEEIKPGMILAKSIVDKNQREILSKGTKLTDYHKTLFKKWNLPHIIIEDDSEPVDSKSKGGIRDQAVQRVNKRIRWKPGHPIEEEIYEVAIQHAEHFLLNKEE